jgi:hypothetical protein
MRSFWPLQLSLPRQDVCHRVVDAARRVDVFIFANARASMKRRIKISCCNNL